MAESQALDYGEGMDRLMRDRAPYALLALTCLAGWLFKWHCGAFWVGNVQYVTGCYSDAVPFWGLRGVAAGQAPYFQARMEYPVLTGALIWVEGGITRLGGARADAADFLTIVSGVNAVLAFVVLAMMRGAGVDRARQFAWSLSPLLVLYLGHNWDMLAVAFAVGALLAARRGRDATATALAALGTAAKLFPVLMLPLFGLGALFKRGERLPQRLASAATLVAVAVLAWGVVNLPVAIGAFQNWSEFYRFSGERSGTAGSVWELASMLGVAQIDVPTRNLWSFAAFAAGAVAIVAAGWPRHRDRLWLLFTPVLAWFLLTSKVYSPQFDLWLYPFAILTSRRLWPVAWFALGDALAYFAEFWIFAGLATPKMLAVAAVIRAGAMLWIIGSALTEPPPAWISRTDPRDSAADRPRSPDLSASTAI
ncbi:hypothetical protein [Sphingomonas sp. EC-HK361]|uniref:hypothetical protein n=1 Tax=Sphingomonas sp. EC-HK361 TaxID=2038397 RepID=UPI001F24CC8C|nr:hypothetical protein [Sphingomonas sp. EC-HK361]